MPPALQQVMTRIRFTVLALVMTAGTLPLACDGSDGTAAEEQAVPAREIGTLVDADSLSGPADAEPADAEERPDRVYHVLTDFDWYARGEPIVLDGTAYSVSGDVLRMDARTLERSAEYGGVDVYRRAGDANLYVPVYDGYWLAFAPDPNAPRPAPADSTIATP
ncbi:MAG: hypothetical protein ACYC28_09860 [Longimicrobiales bacterium]